MLVEHGKSDELNGLELPFGYYVERSGNLLILCRSEGSFVAAFEVREVDLFEVELTVWEDAE